MDIKEVERELVGCYGDKCPVCHPSKKGAEMTTELTKQDVVKMRKEVNKTRIFGAKAPKGREYWDVNRIVKTLERFTDELVCEGCFDPNCGRKEISRNQIIKEWLQSSIDNLMFIEEPPAEPEIKPCPFCGSEATINELDFVKCTNNFCPLIRATISAEWWEKRA